MFDPHTAPIHSEYRRLELLREAERDRLVAAARREVAGAIEPLWQDRRPVWRPALYRVGAWLVETGERLQAAAEPRVLAA